MPLLSCLVIFAPFASSFPFSDSHQINTASQKRLLNLQEFQAKKLMDKFGVRTQKWIIGSSKVDVERSVKENLSPLFSND